MIKKVLAGALLSLSLGAVALAHGDHGDDFDPLRHDWPTEHLTDTVPTTVPGYVQEPAGRLDCSVNANGSLDVNVGHFSEAFIGTVKVDLVADSGAEYTPVSTASRVTGAYTYDTDADGNNTDFLLLTDGDYVGRSVRLASVNSGNCVATDNGRPEGWVDPTNPPDDDLSSDTQS